MTAEFEPFSPRTAGILAVVVFTGLLSLLLYGAKYAHEAGMAKTAKEKAGVVDALTKLEQAADRVAEIDAETETHHKLGASADKCRDAKGTPVVTLEPPAVVCLSPGAALWKESIR